MKAKAGLILGTFDPVLTVARLVVGGAFLLMVTLRPTIATSQEANAQDQAQLPPQMFCFFAQSCG
jgi:hypothetical protein